MGSRLTSSWDGSVTKPVVIYVGTSAYVDLLTKNTEPHNRFLARDAGQLAKAWHPKRADKKKRFDGAGATHLAAAVRLGCDYLMTHDEGFPLRHTVNGVRVVRPKAVWPEHLLDIGPTLGHLTLANAHSVLDKIDQP